MAVVRLQPPARLPIASDAMKLSMMISYSGDFHADVDKVVELEKAGLDVVWVPEAYSFDAVSQMGYLAASWRTPSRTPGSR